MKVSVWVDCGWSRIQDHLQAHLKALGKLHITRVCVMCNQPSDNEFNMASFPAEGCRRFSDVLRPLGIGLTLTTWAQPTRAYLDGLGEELPELADQVGSDIELDLEGQWTEAAARRAGWTLEQAENYLLGCLRPLPTGRRLCITPAYVRPQLQFAKRCDEVAMQCYSRCGANDPARAWDAWSGPGQYQQRGARMLRKELPQAHHVLGLAAWDQEYPGHDAAESMARAWDTCEQASISEVRYWSWTWIVGTDAKKRGYAFRFLKEKA